MGNDEDKVGDDGGGGEEGLIGSYVVFSPCARARASAPVDEPSTNSTGGGRRLLKASMSLAGRACSRSGVNCAGSEVAEWSGEASICALDVVVVEALVSDVAGGDGAAAAGALLSCRCRRGCCKLPWGEKAGCALTPATALRGTL